MNDFIIGEYHGQPGIRCMRCGRISHDPLDIEARYCTACHRFLGHGVEEQLAEQPGPVAIILGPAEFRK